MMNVLKKTEFITYRTDEQLKAALVEITAEKKWSMSLLTEEIIREWLQEHRPDVLRKVATAFALTIDEDSDK